MEKVKLDVLRPWISKKITEYLHIEDDVVVEFVYNQLEDKVNNLTNNRYNDLAFFFFCNIIHPLNVCNSIVSMSEEDANQYDGFFEW